MNSGGERPGQWILINLAALVVVTAGLKAAASIVTLLLVSVFVAVVSAPAVVWLRQKRVPSALAALLVVLAVIGVLTVMGVLVGTSINGFVKAAPAYKARMNTQMAVVFGWLEAHGVAISGVKLLESLDPGALMSVVGNVFNAVGTLLGNSVMILLVVTFILLEVPSFPAKFLAAFGSDTGSMERFHVIAVNVERYLAWKTVVSLVTGALAGLWVAVLGLDFPLLWGLLAFLLNYIPTFGSIIAAVPPAVLALVLLGPGDAALVALGYVVINFVMGNLVEPRLMGRSMGLSTLVVFLSLLGWGWVLGLAGMFLAVPLTMALKIVLESSEESRWIAVLMGPAREAAGAAADTDPESKQQPPAG